MVFQNPHELQHAIVMGHSYETLKVLIQHGLDINSPVEYLENILQVAVEDDNLDWVRFCLENGVDPTAVDAFSSHFILAIAAALASTEISELLIKWGAEIMGSSAFIIASHKGRADLVELLLQNGADVNEMGVASIEEDPEDLEGTALHFVEKGRKDIMQILLDHGGADINHKDIMGKTVMLGMEANGDEVLSSTEGENGGH